MEVQGHIPEKGHAIVFGIRKTCGRTDAGVAFVIQNRIVSELFNLPSGISERIIKIKGP